MWGVLKGGVPSLYNDFLRKHIRIYNAYGIPKEYLRGYLKSIK